MARKKKPPEHPNHERWLVSYADFITLLFAFFVVMFASSQTDKNRAQQISDSVNKAIDEGHGVSAAQMLAAILGGSRENKGKGNAMFHGPGGTRKVLEEKKKKETQLAELMPSLKVLSEELKKEIESGKIQISMQQRGLAISFTEAALFASGEDVVEPDAYDAIAKVAAAIAKLPNPVRLEGHTDSVPINTPRFRSNWELSAARSIAVLELLTTRFHVPRERLSIAGYADTAPVDTNSTEEGRARNRRVDIVILNETGVMAEPAKYEAGGKSPGAEVKSQKPAH